MHSSRKIILSLSKSPGTFGTYMYNKIFDQYSIPWHYQTIKVANNEDFLLLCSSFRAFEEFQGMSISMPYKNLVSTIFTNLKPCFDLPFLIENKVCNTIVKEGSSICSYSTDIAFLKVFMNNFNLTGHQIYIYGSGSMAHLASMFFSNLDFNVTIIPRDSLPEHIDLIQSNLDCSFINCTPAYIESLFPTGIPKIPILDLPVRKDTYLLSNEYYMSGIDATLHQFRYQLMLYTDISLSLPEIRSIYETYSS